MFEAYNSPEFEAALTYTGSDLGALWAKDKTSFRLWAPTAEAVQINLYAGGAAGVRDLLAQLPMRRDICGTWVADHAGDLHGTYYTYLVTVDGKSVEACDPYACTTGVNGHRAMILDPARTDPPGWDTDTDPHAGKSPTDAVIYELHLRDLSMDPDAGIRNKGKFLGLAETGTTSPTGLATGLDYIRNLGVTHIHLLPVFDYGFTDESLPAPQYNWGYDPENYNVPEGSYATDAFHGEVRVREMKQMIHTLHENGLSVVMDVVYNHVYEGADFCFNRIVPGYFSRINSHGVWSNGTACGNDTATERSMVRKYIVDSVNYWADVYHIDGFRFDLVGLMDVQTINEIVSTVHRRHPNVLFYGEGWNMATEMVKPDFPLAIQPNSAQTPGFAYFSDTIRDLLRGSIMDHRATGFVSGAAVPREVLDACFVGMPYWAAQPSQVVNYVSCHDNHTLFDRIALSTPGTDSKTRARMNRLAAAFCFLSQGIPFLQAGEELLRSKPDGKGGYDENSYRSPDRINAIQWSALEDPACRKNLDYYRGLIAFRKAHPALRQYNRAQILRQVTPVALKDPHAAAYRIDEGAHELLVIFNAGTHPLSMPLSAGVWDIYICGDEAGTAVLAHAEGLAHAAPISTTVLSRRKP